MVIFTADWLTTIFKEHRGNSEQVSIEEVTSDSRKKTVNALFIPLVGEKFDGHAYIEQAIDHGAVAAIWNKKKPLPSFLPNNFLVFFVEDTLEALQRLAVEYRNKINPTVIGITGSNGKTTTKDIVTAVLGSKYKTHATVGNLNNHIGVPLTILSMKLDTEMLVLEMGMNHFNEIDLLSKIASPDYAIITNIGESHLEFLGSRQGIAEAKLEITNGLKSDGKLIIDGDEKLLEHIKESNNIIKCGFDNSNDFIIENVLVKPNQTRFHLSDGMDYSIPLLGKHHAKNASYAIALGKQLGMNGEQLKNALNNIQLTSMRFEMLKGVNGVSIINDAYNASPTSMKAAIEVVKEIPDYDKKVLVLGDIFELGEASFEMHQSIADVIDQSITALYTLGKNIIGTNEQVENNKTEIVNQHYESKDDLIKALTPYLNKDTIILFKASRGMKFESMVEKIITSDESLDI